MVSSGSEQMILKPPKTNKQEKERDICTLHVIEGDGAVLELNYYIY